MKTAHIKIIVYETTWRGEESLLEKKEEEKKIEDSGSREKHKEEYNA